MWYYYVSLLCVDVLVALGVVWFTFLKTLVFLVIYDPRWVFVVGEDLPYV